MTRRPGDTPPHDDLVFWRECMRKTQHTALSAAAAMPRARDPLDLYACPYGPHLHVGRRRTGAHRKPSKVRRDARREWETHDNAPTAAEIRETREALRAGTVTESDSDPDRTEQP